MNINISMALQLSSLVYSILLISIYFSKKRLKSKENSIYIALMVTNVIGLILDIVVVFTMNNINKFPIINDIATKLYLLYYYVWISIFTYYMISISKIKYSEGFRYLLWLLILVAAIVLLTLPQEYNFTDAGMYTSGLAIKFVYLVVFVDMVVCFWLMVYTMIKSHRKGATKFIPLLAFMVLGTVGTIIQHKWPSIILIPAIETLVTFIMYFTLENPDLKMMRELELAKDHAEKANRAKSDFLSSMSHEIRTPLNAIVGFSEMIETEESIEACKEDAKDIVLASHTLLEIVNGILDISKIEANKMEIVNKEYSLLPELENLAKLMVPRIGDKDLKLISNFAPDIPSVLYGDIGKIKEVITNLLTNAVKYTDSGTINFNVSCINEKEYSSFVISVEDTGRGIKADHIDKLFTKFQRLEEDKNTTIEGTGLGLAITKNLVEMMGGKIVVQSEYGKGSIFTVYLKQKIVKLHAGSAGDAVSSEEKLDFSGKKVLVVDDNGLNIKLAKRLLENYNIEIDTAESGFECIDKVKENKYDLILLDDMMPKMRGTETLAKLKEDSSFNIPVVALTANSLSGMREVYLNAGFVGYLAKPIEKAELNKILSKYLGNEKDYSDKKILIVDDNKINIKIASKILSTFKFQIDEALSGAECLEKTSNTKYDIIFMDYMMPGMNGVETFAKLKEQDGFDTPVVVLTADVVDNAKEKFMKDGFVDYISKPIDQKYLKEVIDKLIK